MVEQGLRDHDHARRAVAALEGVVVEERLLDRVQALGGVRPSRASSPGDPRRPRPGAGRTGSARRRRAPCRLPQPPCRQPSFVAVAPSWSRRTDWSVVIGRDHDLDLAVAELEGDDRRGHASDPPAGARGQLLEGTADEHADHPPSIPVGGDRVRERVDSPRWPPRPPRRCRPGRGVVPTSARSAVASADRVRSDRAQRDPGVGHAVAVAATMRVATVTTAGVLACLAPELDEGRRSARDRDLDRGEQLVVGEPRSS